MGDSAGRAQKKVGVIIPMLIVAAIVLPVGWFAGHHFLEMAFKSLFIKAPPERKFMEAWGSDVKHLAKINALHPGFSDLALVKVKTSSDRLKKSFKLYPIEEFKPKPNGHYTLEIFLDEIEDGGVVVQYDLVERKSGNTVWELGRTFPHRLK
jgi:hypothetical protein